ncbi:hypothetical protein CFR78_10830 [Komagataeibacter rhaeticus]|uniref:hypothetical protein n=1 Tax=Komagataeibacter rhaeticus TaxID=215221 RepID=UPI0004D41A33|nr:hypothetical protein [Komagataeibacter rhaeticus]KDU96448.1 hypothetical protein GLUCORHAEAF1_01620 [Komagataeibacter rhaeticus AF1]PYD53247.1 hypothetical protein CFR78_10830 [Komagataeibacter rhaeticus]GBQ12659.1 hypothetical protein AA16663_1246 [Komagataeibacter rhaeticus DSM 16663]
MSGFVLKQGNTFRLAAIIRTFDGRPLDLTGCTFTSQMRDVLGNSLADLSVQIVPGRTGIIQITYGSDTGTWPVGRYRCDLRTIWPDGTIQSSQTFAITVIAGITVPATESAA